MNGRVIGCIDVGRAGIADPFRDLAILWNDLREFGDPIATTLWEAYGIATPDQRRLAFHLGLDELFSGRCCPVYVDSIAGKRSLRLFDKNCFTADQREHTHGISVASRHVRLRRTGSTFVAAVRQRKSVPIRGKAVLQYSQRM